MRVSQSRKSIADITAKLPSILWGLFIAMVNSKYTDAKIQIKETIEKMDKNALAMSSLLLRTIEKAKNIAEHAAKTAPSISIGDLLV